MADTVYRNGRPSADDMDSLSSLKKQTAAAGNKYILIEHADDFAQLTDGNWIVQKPWLFGKDIRVFVIGKKVEAAVLRVPFQFQGKLYVRWIGFAI